MQFILPGKLQIHHNNAPDHPPQLRQALFATYTIQQVRSETPPLQT
jgi:hypothetical protein